MLAFGKMPQYGVDAVIVQELCTIELPAVDIVVVVESLGEAARDIVGVFGRVVVALVRPVGAEC